MSPCRESEGKANPPKRRNGDPDEHRRDAKGRQPRMEDEPEDRRRNDGKKKTGNAKCKKQTRDALWMFKFGTDGFRNRRPDWLLLKRRRRWETHGVASLFRLLVRLPRLARLAKLLKLKAGLDGLFIFLRVVVQPFARCAFKLDEIVLGHIKVNDEV